MEKDHQFQLMGNNGELILTHIGTQILLKEDSEDVIDIKNLDRNI